MSDTSKSVVVVVGPTGIGKTAMSIKLAQHFNSAVISADSRQIYRELKIGVATPSELQMESIPHYLIGTKSIFDYYNAYEFEQEALAIAGELFTRHQTLVMTGGSMMYVDTFCNGIDMLPTVDADLRQSLQEQLETGGLHNLRRQLKLLDPLFYDQVDLENPKRVVHALEMCLMTGRPYSELRTNPKHERPFKIIKVGLEMEQEKLYQKINHRVDKMMDAGLLQEAKDLYPNRQLNALNTVGYKELFQHFDGGISLQKAIELIKRNSRRYAKKQMTWFKRDKEIFWFIAENTEEIIKFVQRNVE